jgi:hypothetical protein
MNKLTITTSKLWKKMGQINKPTKTFFLPQPESGRRQGRRRRQEAL